MRPRGLDAPNPERAAQRAPFGTRLAEWRVRVHVADCGVPSDTTAVSHDVPHSLPPADGSAHEQVRYYQERLDELTGQSLKADAVISRTTRELKQRRQGFALLSELHRAISTDQTPSQMYALAIGSVQKALKLDRTVVLEMVPPVAQGMPVASLNMDAPTDSGVVRFRATAWAGVDDAAAAALKNAEIAMPADWLRPDASLLATKSAPATPLMTQLREKVGVPYFVCVPVWCEGQAAALLLSGRMREAKPFFPPMDDGDINTLQSLAGFLGGALHNARLFAHQKRMAASFARFVPRQFLEFLGRGSIVDVQLGDQTQRQMTILFSDIRSFTTISEKMTPKENFDFINQYLEYAAPVIRANHGFIDKYIGDSVMALFPSRGDDALHAALEATAVIDERALAVAGKFVARVADPELAIGAGRNDDYAIGWDYRPEDKDQDVSIYPEPTELARRLEAPTDAIWKRLEGGGQLYYAEPRPMSANKVQNREGVSNMADAPATQDACLVEPIWDRQAYRGIVRKRAEPWSSLATHAGGAVFSPAEGKSAPAGLTAGESRGAGTDSPRDIAGSRVDIALGSTVADAVVHELDVPIENLHAEDEVIGELPLKGREDAYARAEMGGTGAFLAIGGQGNGLDPLQAAAPAAAGSAVPWWCFSL